MSFFASKSSSSGWRAPSLAKALGAAVAALGLASLTSLAPGVEAGRAAGQYETVLDNSLASAMMMALIDENNVMILDKTEGNRARTADNKPVWGAIMSLADNTPRALELISNPFCASGFTLGNGSWVVVGGNNPVGYGGATVQPTNVYGDYDGRTAIRIMDPNTDSSKLFWNDNSSFMDSQRWYPGVEVLADGSAIILGGSTTGGFINRNYPTSIQPSQRNRRDRCRTFSQALRTPPGSSSLPRATRVPSTTSWPQHVSTHVPHASGLMFMQANYSTTLWNYTSGDENNAYHNLDDMPGRECANEDEGNESRG
ncbi:hypothetical protein L7F22_068381 [Adiantum nelumboides]|nr:hypothetical protein [Adiantum nelumboides]